MAFQYETVNSADMSTHYHARSLIHFCHMRKACTTSPTPQSMQIARKYIESARQQSTYCNQTHPHQPAGTVYTVFPIDTINSNCKWRPTTAGFAEQNGRDAELSGHF